MMGWVRDWDWEDFVRRTACWASGFTMEEIEQRAREREHAPGSVDAATGTTSLVLSWSTQGFEQETGTTWLTIGYTLALNVVFVWMGMVFFSVMRRKYPWWYEPKRWINPEATPPALPNDQEACCCCGLFDWIKPVWTLSEDAIIAVAG